MQGGDHSTPLSLSWTDHDRASCPGMRSPATNDSAASDLHRGRSRFSRRAVLGAGLAAAAWGRTTGPALAAPRPDSLATRAARRGILYGAAVWSEPLRTNAALQAALARDCAVIVPSFETKWGQTEQRRGIQTYARSDFVVDWALRNGLAARGHAAVWHLNLPVWAGEALKEPGGPAILDDHIRHVMGHYKGRIVEWDVVNEAVEPRDGAAEGLRNSVLYKALGPDYITRAFKVAREADPSARLFYNDYGIEYDSPDNEDRRVAVLKLLTGLRRAGLVDGLGIQCHLKVGNRFTPEVLRRFLGDVAALGLRIALTEFDVNDSRLPADVPARDAAVAEHAKRFLDVALAQVAVRELVTWGLSDVDTWLNAKEFARADGQPSRCLPLDAAMERKPLWHAIAACLDAAPAR